MLHRAYCLYDFDQQPNITDTNPNMGLLCRMFMGKAFCFINTLEIVHCTTDAPVFPVSISNAY